MTAMIPSATVVGVDGRPVTVEVHVTNGLPSFSIVGLPDAACRESRDRVRAALTSSEIGFPLKRITVNLAPTALRKCGPVFDVAIAIGLLVAAGELDPECTAGMAFLGELGLDGSIRRVPGVVPLVAAITAGEVVVPVECAGEAAVVGRHRVRVASSLRRLLACLRGQEPWPDPPPSAKAPPGPPEPDMADVRGQHVGRTAIEVCAAGGHHLLMSGPPGSGKTMLARRLPGLLAKLEGDDALTVTRIHSAAGMNLPPSGLIERPPFRAPHHSASAISLVGGGSSWMRPGEASLAHMGVLFLDEMGEFGAFALDQLRQPLEDGVVRLCRARESVTFPSRFLLVGATNPCPCGQGGPQGVCRCSDASRARYSRRFSGPLLDRFDLRVIVARPEVSSLMGGDAGESTATVAARVAAVRRLAAARGVRCNAEIPMGRLDELAPLSPAASALLEHRLRAGLLSARGMHRIRRVARTIADLDGGGRVVSEDHVCLALGLRVELAPHGEAA